MKRWMDGVRRWRGIGAVLLSLALAACGGGGSGGASDESVALADSRSDSYLAAAADGRPFTLALEFNERKYLLLDGTSGAGGRVNQSGTITQQGDEFLLQPDNPVAPAGANPARFRFAGEALVGELPLPQGAVPFIAPRQFVTTLAQAAGTYNLFERRIDRDTGAGIGSSIRQAQITADGRYLTCNDAAVFRIADCPAASIVAASLSIFSGTDAFNVFAGPAESFAFRIGRVGNERVLLRTDSGPGQPGSDRQFAVGLPAVDAFTPGSFVGGSTDPAWGTFTLGEATFASSATLPSGASVTRSGASGPGPVVDVRAVQAADAGNLFAGRNAEVGIVVAAPGNASAPGFMAIGKVQ